MQVNGSDSSPLNAIDLTSISISNKTLTVVMVTTLTMVSLRISRAMHGIQKNTMYDINARLLNSYFMII